MSGILKNSSFEIIENASHEVNIDNPEKLATLLQFFYEKIKYILMSECMFGKI